MQHEPNTVIFEDRQEFPVGDRTGVAKTQIAYFGAGNFSFYKWRICVWTSTDTLRDPSLKFEDEVDYYDVASHGEIIRRIVLHVQDIISKVTYTTADMPNGNDDQAPF